jgi:hypothetical protein
MEVQHAELCEKAHRRGCFAKRPAVYEKTSFHDFSDIYFETADDYMSLSIVLDKKILRVSMNGEPYINCLDKSMINILSILNTSRITLTLDQLMELAFYVGDIYTMLRKSPELAEEAEFRLFNKLYMYNFYNFIKVPPEFRIERFMIYSPF